jgi:hypothetical protein
MPLPPRIMPAITGIPKECHAVTTAHHAGYNRLSEGMPCRYRRASCRPSPAFQRNAMPLPPRIMPAITVP